MRISLKDIEIRIAGQLVGGAEGLSLKVERDNTLAYEAGNYNAVEIVGGKFTVSGTLDIAYLDNELLNELFPNQAIPYSFTLTGEDNSGKSPNRKVEVYGVVLDSVDLNSLGIGDAYAKNSLPFKALGHKFV